MNKVSERRPAGRLSSSGRRRALAVLAGASAGVAMTLLQPATAGAAELGDAEKSIVFIGITWEGYVEYPTADGGLLWSDKVTAQSNCTGWFASEEGHIVTAGHCVDPERGRTNVLRQFLTDYDALDLLPEATTYWTVEGETQGSDPVRSVAVVQPAGVEGVVIDSP
jgi:serine protease Do